VTPDRFGLEHRVERRDLVGPHRRQVQILGDAGDQLVGQPAVVLFLRGKAWFLPMPAPPYLPDLRLPILNIKILPGHPPT
jgi:hypothetical protein